jgi:hypothetical protein
LDLSVARSALARRTTVVRRSGPSPKLLKLQARLKNLGGRAAKGAAAMELKAITVGAPVAFTLLERRGTRIPSVMGIDPAIVLGAVLSLGGKRIAGGKNGARIEAAGDGLLAYGAARSAARGSIRVAGEGGDDDDDDDDDDDE